MTKINYNIIIVSTVIVFIAIVVLVIFLKKNKKDNKTVVLPKSLEGQVTDAEKQEATSLCAKLYEDMKGLNWRGHNISLYRELNNKDDRMLAIIAIAWENNYDGSLAQWLEDENFSWYEEGVMQGALIDGIISRLLNLKV